MNLLALRYFQVVARHQHVGRAAEDLHVSQPSLSRTIARLESDLGVPLFERTGRAVRLNRFGAAFLARVDRALADLDDGRRELTEATGLARGSVEIVSETMLSLSDILPEFRARHPEVDVRLRQGTPDLMLDRLRQGDVDFALASQVLDGDDLVVTEVFTEPVLLALPPGHRLCGRDSVTVQEIADEPQVATGPGGWQRALLERLFAARGLRPRVVCETDEPAATLYVIATGLGVGLVPAMSLRHGANAAPWTRLADDTAVRTLSLIWRDNAFLSAAAHRFRDIARETGRRVMAEQTI